MKTQVEILSQARILIIDDEEDSASGLARLVAKAGYAVCITITNPLVAVTRFLDLRPDVVLLDLHMEPMDGMEVLRRISILMDPSERPPVIMLTADTSPEARHEALAAGASDFLSKPFDHEEVILRMANALSLRMLYQRAQNYSQSLEQMVQKRTEQLQKRTRELEATVNDLKAAQKQVIQQERTRALAEMASGIAHDMNNSLTLVLGYGEMLLRDLDAFPSRSQAKIFLEHLIRAARDNATIVSRLREFYRPRSKDENVQAVDLNRLLEEVVSFTAPKWQSQAEAGGASVDMEFDARPIPVVAGVPAELREVFTNLIFNAVEAMPAGGRIRLSTEVGAGLVRVLVSDNGTGMTEETRSRCLEPFYTTKGDKGTGLGLAVSFGIVQRHGGKISVESGLNQGTTFRLDFPVAAEEDEPKKGEQPKDNAAPLRVLVVDDQKAIREIVGEYLAVDHHSVECAADSAEALKKYQASRFDLVITDRAMPGVNGDALATAIKRLNPHQPVIMLTGFADWIGEVGGANPSVDMVLGKPLEIRDLRRAIFDVVPMAKVA